MSGSADMDSDSDSSDSNATAVVLGIVLVLDIITVVLRFYARKITKVGVKWDDWLILAAIVATLVVAGLLIWSNSLGVDGPSISDVTDPNYIYSPEDTLFFKLTYICATLYFSIVTWAKLGILIMYNRIFNVDRTFRYQLVLASFLVVGWWIGCTVASFTTCVPLQLAWSTALAEPGYCFNSNIFWFASGICEVFIDCVILILPIRAVLGMRLSTRKKITVTCLFLLGGFVIITGLLKSIFSYVPGQDEPAFNNGEVWATVHVGMAVICASLPILRPLITKVSGSAFMTKLRTSFIYQRASDPGASSNRHQARRKRADDSSGEAESWEVNVDLAVSGRSLEISEATV